MNNYLKVQKVADYVGHLKIPEGSLYITYNYSDCSGTPKSITFVPKLQLDSGDQFLLDKSSLMDKLSDSKDSK